MIAHFKKLDWIIIISALLLASIGLLSIYSSSLGRGDFLNFQKQIIFLGIGFLLMLFFSFFDWRVFKTNPYFILALYFLSLGLLAGLFFLAPEIRGVRSWYRVGFLALDPIEFTKIVLIILIAKFFSMRHIEMYRVVHIFLSGIYVFLPAALIFFQPDFGSAIILVMFWITILIISGIKLRHFLVLILLGVISFIFMWSFLIQDYQKERITSFLQPQTEPLGISWSQKQTQIAIGTGSIFGQGIGKGSQTQYGFLPLPQTDFIFAAIAEEIGLVGVAILLILFSTLIWRILKIALLVQSNFPRFFAVGLATILISQMFIHIGMNLGLFPIIGISLPLVSYGGSGLISIFVALGILQSIKVH
ncbi:rod shape-determining protein RodA [Patescibacteria group bacterium]|nr:rod shape-determining protein RodA [Patescibacteria group bacterium]